MDAVVHKRGISLPEDTARVSVNYKLSLLSDNFGFLIFRTQQVRREVTVMAEILDYDHQEEIGMLLHNGGRRNTYGTKITHLVPLVFPDSTVTVKKHI